MEILLFDLDNTLYSAERELFPLIDERINRFMNEVVGIPLTEVDSLRRSYWQRYGVTMQGLMQHHGVDPEEYLAFVHDISLDNSRALVDAGALIRAMVFSHPVGVRISIISPHHDAFARYRNDFPILFSNDNLAGIPGCLIFHTGRNLRNIRAEQGNRLGLHVRAH